MRVRSVMSAAGTLPRSMKATNSVRVSLTPSSQPATSASFHSTPISQAIGGEADQLKPAQTLGKRGGEVGGRGLRAVFRLFRQQQARFEKGQPGGHHQIVGGQLQSNLAGGLDEGKILFGQRQNGNPRQINLLAARQLQQQVKRALEPIDVDEEGFPLVARSILRLERQFLRHNDPSGDSSRPGAKIRRENGCFTRSSQASRRLRTGNPQE